MIYKIGDLFAVNRGARPVVMYLGKHTDNGCHAMYLNGGGVSFFNMGDLIPLHIATTLHSMQLTLPWDIKYPAGFDDHQHHAVLHLQKALGKIAAIYEDDDHGRKNENAHELYKFLADLVICAMRLGNLEGIDLAGAVLCRMVRKNGIWKEDEINRRINGATLL